MRRDIDYVVKDGEVIIVDEFTGRLMLGRRYNEGLHQAIEAKEHVTVARESKTLATITFQNFFRMYVKLSGMTGTASTEAEEFEAIYKLDIVEIPTNRPLIRIDYPDVIYKNENGKNRAIIAQIEACHSKGQPVLVGTISIEKSEYLSSLLKRKGIPHNVLNAKQHEREAEIVAQAGKFGAVTIATNMAGRGTDIMLGGNAEYTAKNDLKKAGYTEDVINDATGYAETEDEDILSARKLYGEKLKEHKLVTDAEAEKVRAVGGLFIIGTERHESRRIDNQLRGRSGRQGDPGETRFYIAMTDDIMRLFGSERVLGMMESLGVDEDTPIDQKILSNAIEQAQRRIESRNFQSRKNVLEFDDVMNMQRGIIYDQRRKVLDGEDIKSYVQGMIKDVIDSAVAGVGDEHGKIIGKTNIEEVVNPFMGLFLTPKDIDFSGEYSKDSLRELLSEKATTVYEAKEKSLGFFPNTTMPIMRELERVIMLRVVDEFWMEHIDSMQELKQGVMLRAYAQVKPIDEYKREGYEMFEAMVQGIKEEVVRRIYIARVNTQSSLERKSVSRESTANVGGDSSTKRQPVRNAKKIGRNDPCPCGKKRPNGLPMKYKDCCGRNQ